MKKKLTLSAIVSILIALAKSDNVNKEEIKWLRNEISRWFFSKA